MSHLTQTDETKIVWASHTDTTRPSIQEILFTGSVTDALEKLQAMAHNAKFILGQLLAKDGKVLATAVQGAMHRP